VRDLKLEVESVASLRIDYKFDNAAQATRDLVAIRGSKGESLGERIIDLACCKFVRQEWDQSLEQGDSPSLRASLVPSRQGIRGASALLMLC
jgi:hypothetical protein